MTEIFQYIVICERTSQKPRDNVSTVEIDSGSVYGQRYEDVEEQVPSLSSKSFLPVLPLPHNP